MPTYSFVGGKWPTGQITWSLAGIGAGVVTNPNYPQDANSAPISAPISGTARATVAAAFARWAAVTGLTFTQVPDTPDPAQAAGIRVGYAFLNPGQTGTFSTTKLGGGATVGQDTVIRLEQPASTGNGTFNITAVSSGIYAYNINGATNYQLLLREIGHAIGLGDSTDPTSVMYSTATALNRDLSGSDVAALRALYAAGATLRGKPADYTIATLGTGQTLVRDDASFGRDGSRTVAALNTVTFGDGSVGLVDVTGNAEAMARLYQAAFTRAPDLAGLQNYAGLLDQGSIGLPAIADGFLASPEYQRAYGAQDTTAFVNQLYQNVLHRGINPADPGDAGALQAWSNLVNAQGRGAALLAFSDSQENHRLTLPTAGDKYDAAATRLYKAAFNRAPDGGGLASTRTALANGASAEQVAGGFTASGEFQRAYGSLSSTDFVSQLYRNVLGRAPDAGGLGANVTALNNGASRGYVLAGLAESDENRIGTASATHDGWVLTR